MTAFSKTRLVLGRSARAHTDAMTQTPSSRFSRVCEGRRSSLVRNGRESNLPGHSLFEARRLRRFSFGKREIVVAGGLTPLQTACGDSVVVEQGDDISRGTSDIHDSATTANLKVEAMVFEAASMTHLVSNRPQKDKESNKGGGGGGAVRSKEVGVPVRHALQGAVVGKRRRVEQPAPDADGLDLLTAAVEAQDRRRRVEHLWQGALSLPSPRLVRPVRPEALST